MLTGWWRVSDIEELRALVNALHSRGIREKGLQRQMQKYMEIIPQVCTKHKPNPPSAHMITTQAKSPASLFVGWTCPSRASEEIHSPDVLEQFQTGPICWELSQRFHPHDIVVWTFPIH